MTPEQSAPIALAILQAHMTADEFSKVSSFADCHDYCDANIALYGAFCAVHFAEPDFETDSDWLNALCAEVDSHIKARGTITLQAQPVIIPLSPY